ncbi:MFS transporter [Timonella sp. A28]|uniref:MFS transporter n=1 Tax=Timonella sp. A28 TaxID=3442640 RepID=UPI003EBD3F79
MPQPPRERSLAYHHDFRQLWIGDALSQVGAQLTALALPIFAVTTLRATEMQMGFLNASQTAAFLLIGLPAGAWIDRMRKRNVLIVADVVRGAVLAVVVALALTGHASMPVLYGASLILSVATVFFDVAHLSYVPSLVGLQHVSEGNTKLQATYSIAAVAVPAVGGLLLKIVTAPLLIGVNVVTYFASVVYLLRIKKRETLPPKDSHLPLGKAIHEGLAFIVKTPLLNRLVFATGASALFATMGWTMIVKYVVDSLGVSKDSVGLVLSASAIGGILGAFLVRRVTLRVGEGRVIALSALVIPIFYVGIPLAQPLHDGGVNPIIPLVVSGFLMQIANTFFNVSQVSFRQRLCPPHLLGRMNASFRFIVWGGMPLASLIGGVIASQFGMATMMWVVVVGQFVAALPLVFSPFMRMRDLPGGNVQTVEV